MGGFAKFDSFSGVLAAIAASMFGVLAVGMLIIAAIF